MRLLLTLPALALLTSCAAAVSDRPCPRVTEFPPELQQRAADELPGAPALEQMMNAMAADRAFNRAVCA
jgi:hypothetical protein